jgi:hypothetical protein
MTHEYRRNTIAKSPGTRILISFGKIKWYGGVVGWAVQRLTRKRIPFGISADPIHKVTPPLIRGLTGGLGGLQLTFHNCSHAQVIAFNKEDTRSRSASAKPGQGPGDAMALQKKTMLMVRGVAVMRVYGADEESGKAKSVRPSHKQQVSWAWSAVCEAGVRIQTR